MRTTTRLAQLAAACGAALFICTFPALAQECPEYVTTFDPGCGVVDVALSPGYAVVVCTGSLLVLDVSNPYSPVVVAIVAISGAPASHVSVFGDFVYVNVNFFTFSNAPSLIVYDVSQPSNPIYLGHTPWESADPPMGHSVATEGYVYVVQGDGVTVVDVSDPYNPIQVGNLTVAGHGDALDVAVADSFAYVLYVDGFFVFDVTNPSQANLVGSHDDWGDHDRFRRLSVDPTGYAYVTRWTFFPGSTFSDACLHVFDVTDPSNPIHLGFTCVWREDHTGVAASGGYAYVLNPVAEVLHGISVINPDDPYHMGMSGTLDQTDELAAGWGYVYVADGGAGLSIYRECGLFFDGFESGDTSAWSAAVP